MSMVSYTYKPRNPECLYGIGATLPDPRAVAASGGVESDDGVDFWHPALPEVCRFAAEPEYDPPCPDETGVRLASGRWSILAALVFLLFFPLAARAAEPCRVNVNTASPAQLALLVNTGPALASKIEAARKPEPLDAAKLDAIPGIGPKWRDYNAPYVAYSGETTCKDKLKKPAATGETESDTVRKEASGGGQ